MNSLQIFPAITAHLLDFVKRSRQLNSLNLTDEANFAEDLFGDILGVVLGVEFESANSTVANASTIDLKAETKKIAVQVTTQNSNFARKKQTTIAGFKKDDAFRGYRVLYILFLSDIRPDATILKEEIIDGKFKYIGWDIDLFLKKIKPLNAIKKQQILQLLEHELKPLSEARPVWNKRKFNQLSAVQPRNPIRNIHVERGQTVSDLANFCRSGHTLVVGKPGIGKSFVLNLFNRHCWESDQIAVTIPINELIIGDENEIGKMMGAGTYNWLTYLSSISVKAGFLIFDAYDTAKEEHLKNNVLLRISSALRGLPSNWKILVSVRIYDAQKSQKLLQLFAGGGTGELQKCKTFYVEELKPEQLLTSLKTISDGEVIYRACNESLQDLIRIPYFLSIFEEVVTNNSSSDLSGLRGVKTEEQLLQIYWDRKVLPDRSDFEREKVLRTLTEAMADQKNLSIFRGDILPHVNAQALSELVRDGIIVASGLMDRNLSFSHNILFDFAVASLYLPDEKEAFVNLIRQDITAPFIYRPSYWYLLSKLWDTDTERFWSLYYFVNRQPESTFKIIHLVLFNAVVAFRFISINDIQPLLNAGQREHYGPLINKFLQALRFTTGFQDFRNDDDIALSLSGHLHDDFLSMFGVYLEQLFENTSADRHKVALASASYLDYIFAKRKKTPEKQYFLDWNGQKYGIKCLIEVLKYIPDRGKELLRELLLILQDQLFPIDYFSELCRSIDKLEIIDPLLASEVFLAVYSKNENSNEKTVKGGVAFSLSMERRQEWHGVHHGLEKYFPNFLARHPSTAIGMGIKLTNLIHTAYYATPTAKYELDILQIKTVFEPDNGHFEHFDQYTDGPAKLIHDLFEYLRGLLVKGAAIDQYLKIIVTIGGKGTVWRHLLVLCAKFPSALKSFALELLHNHILLLATETNDLCVELIQRIRPLLAQQEIAAIKQVIESISGTELPINESFLQHKKSKLIDAFDPSKAGEEPAAFQPWYPDKEEECSVEKHPETLTLSATPIQVLAQLSYPGIQNGTPTELLTEAESIYQQLQMVTSWMRSQKIEDLDSVEMSRMQAVNKIIKLRSDLPLDIHAFCVQICVEVLQGEWVKQNFESDPTGMGPMVGTTNLRVQAGKAIYNLSFVQNEQLANLIQKTVYDNDRVVRAGAMAGLNYFYWFDRDAFWALSDQLLTIETDHDCLYQILRNISVHDLPVNAPDQFYPLFARFAPAVTAAHVRSALFSSFVDMVAMLIGKTNDPRFLNIIGQLNTSENFTVSLTRTIFAKVSEIYNRDGILNDSFCNSSQSIILEILAANLQLLRSDRNNDLQWTIVNEVVTRMYFFILRTEDDQVDITAGLKYRFLKPIIQALLIKTYDSKLAIMMGQTAYYLAQTIEAFIAEDPEGILLYTKQLVQLSSTTGFQYDNTTMKLIIKIIEVYLVDYKLLVLEKSNFQLIIGTLEFFADAGWEEALDTIWKLGEIL